MNVTIASGKGGTGKTTFSVNLAYALADRGERVRLLDCDVEEPNDHLFVKPEFTDIEPVEVWKPVWNESLCTGCGECSRACSYNALAMVKKRVLIFDELCHACGVCAYICPEKALTERPVEIGRVLSAPRHNPFFFAHGILNIAQSLSPVVIHGVKKLIDPESINIIDASPGTSCPVVEAVTGADVAVLVTEPTPFGLNDLKLAVGLALKKKVPTCIVINRSDGNDALIVDYAAGAGIPIAGRIPFRREYAEAYSRGDVLAHLFPEFKDTLLGIFRIVSELAGSEPPALPEEENLPVASGHWPPFSRGNADDYKEIAIISGKGGSGKTTVVSSLAVLADDKVLADNDVDAADLHLLLVPSIREEHDFVGGTRFTIDEESCTGCGACAEACRFNAIRTEGSLPDKNVPTYRIDELACEGCGLCRHVCAFDAVHSRPSVTGKWFISGPEYSPLVHARLGIAEENSGRLVTRVRNEAAELTRVLRKGLLLGDGPPGTGCPVIASVSGADLVLVVTEPTVSGVHDMERVLSLADHFGIPSRIVINKSDLNREQAERIERIARERGSRVVARIPFDRNVNDALMVGKTVIEYARGPACGALQDLWEELRKEMKAKEVEK